MQGARREARRAKEGGEAKEAKETRVRVDDSDSEGEVTRPTDSPRHDEGGNDFEMMMARKRQENKRFRKKKDIDVINENDDAIAKMIADMRIAAKEDRDLNLDGKPATNKMAMFPVSDANSLLLSNPRVQF